MSSTLGFTAKVRKEGKITIPSEIREQLNLKQGDFIQASVSKTKWYELLDWSQMNSTVVNIANMPAEARNYITSNYTTDASGITWRTNNV